MGTGTNPDSSSTNIPCDASCTTDASTLDMIKCSDNCHNDTLYYCWNDCKIYNYYAATTDPSQLQTELNALQLSDTTETFCKSQTTVPSCTDALCDAYDSACAWHFQTYDNLIKEQSPVLNPVDSGSGGVADETVPTQQ